MGRSREKKILLEGWPVLPLFFLPWLVGVIVIARAILEVLL